MARAGVPPAPVYTAQRVSAAETALRAPGAMVLGGHPGTAQFAAAGGGAMDLADDILYALSKGWAELKRAATVNTLGPRLGVVVAGFWPAEAGKGSDKVPGRDVPALFSYPLSAVQGSGVSLTPGASTANLPVRGALVLENDRLTLRLLKTGEGSLPGTVPVLKAMRDEATGQDRITVPAVGGLPPRTVLINPVPAPVAPADTGNRSRVPVTPWHTGTEVKPVETLVTTVTPEADVAGLQDFIYWRPDAAGTGVEPVYLVLSDSQGASDSKGKTPELIIDGKIKNQMGERGWSEQNIRDTVAKGVTGKSFDTRSPKKPPPDYLGRNDSASVFGEPGKYVIVNDRTGEVTQISDKTDSKWVDDSRIQWEKGNGK